MEEEGLTFAEIDCRIQRMPQGPAGLLNSPDWLAMWNVIGSVGIVAGLLPSVLIKFFDPRYWMLFMAEAGLVIALIGLAPGFLRNTWMIARAWWFWRSEQVQQLDHDLSHLRELTAWLRSFPPNEVAERLRFVRMTDARLRAKMGLLIGSLDKLGIVPIAIAFVLQVKAYAGGGASLPYWLAIVGLFLTLTYLIAFLASLMSLRLGLYEALLAEATAGTLLDSLCSCPRLV